MALVPQESLILVGILPEKRDLDIARLLGWYRIPLKSAPKVIDVDYVAFFQPGVFGEEHRWRIEYICPVRGHELVSRAELFKEEADHPRAKEEYFKLSLGELIPLIEPILAGEWKRVTFLYTIGELFNKAKTVQNLVVRSDARRILWQNLRERISSENLYPDGDSFNTLDESLITQLLLQWVEPKYNKWNNFYRLEE